MFKKFALAMMMVLCLTPLSMAEYPSEVTILEKPDIARLTDEQLSDTYERTLVEIDLRRSFHTTSGYSPKEFGDDRKLLLFRYHLYDEIQKRNLTVPPEL